MTARAESIAEQLVRHIDANPLRKWRLERGMAFGLIATLMGVTVTTLTKWENGGGMPSSEAFTKLQDLLDNPEIEREWVEWYEKIPRL